jgi:hypothetical protein
MAMQRKAQGNLLNGASEELNRQASNANSVKCVCVADIAKVFVV